MQHTASFHRLPSADAGTLSLAALTPSHGQPSWGSCAAYCVQLHSACSILLSKPFPADSVDGHAYSLKGARLTTSLPPAETVATLARSSSRTSTDSACSSSTSPATVFSMPRVSCRGAQSTHQHLHHSGCHTGPLVCHGALTFPERHHHPPALQTTSNTVRAHYTIGTA